MLQFLLVATCQRRLKTPATVGGVRCRFPHWLETGDARLAGDKAKIHTATDDGLDQLRPEGASICRHPPGSQLAPTDSFADIRSIAYSSLPSSLRACFCSRCAMNSSRALVTAVFLVCTPLTVCASFFTFGGVFWVASHGSHAPANLPRASEPSCQWQSS